MIAPPTELASFEETFVRALRRDVRRRRVRLASVAFLATLVLAGGTALAGRELFGVSGLDNATAPPAPTSIVDVFRTLGEPAPGDTLPAAVPVDARSLGQGIYIAPRDGALCVIAIPGSGQCGRTFRNGIILGGGEIRSRDQENAPFQTDLFGVAQDDVRSIVVQLRDGRSQEIPVETNGFRGSIPDTRFGDIASVQIVDQDGRVLVSDPREYGLIDEPSPSPSAPRTPASPGTSG